jgi:hypothetical protein
MQCVRWKTAQNNVIFKIKLKDFKNFVHSEAVVD